MIFLLLPVSISQISRQSEASVREEELWAKSRTTSLTHPHKFADVEDLDFASDGQEKRSSWPDLL